MWEAGGGAAAGKERGGGEVEGEGEGGGYQGRSCRQHPRPRARLCAPRNYLFHQN